MKSIFRFFTLGLVLLLPLAAAQAMPSVSPISDVTAVAAKPLTLNVVAVDPDGGGIALTATLPAFAALNDPKSGTGIVATTITMTPLAADVGTHSGSVTATVGEASDTEAFQINVTAADANLPPRVSAPATMTATEGALLEFPVTASDAEGDPITALTASGLPTGATFTVAVDFKSGTFSWTPDLKQAGHYDVVFATASGQADSATTHITVMPSDLGPVVIAPIADVVMDEGDTLKVVVLATDPDMETIELSASLPGFATLDAPTSSADVESLLTTITLMPGAGSAGTYPASVTAMSGGDTATEPFTITVISPALSASATLIGSYNVHKKFLCFKVKPVDGSFDLLDADLSSITLSYHGTSITTVKPTHLAYDCDGEGYGDGECDSCEVQPYGDGDRDGDCDDDCDGHEYGDGDDHEYGDGDPDSCYPSHIMACFSMSDLRTLFAGASLPDSLVAATIEGELTEGRTFIAWVGGKHVTDLHNNGDNGDGKDGNEKPDHGKGKLALRIHPNPMNPKADISFTLAAPGKVRIAIYDLSGRLTKTVQEANFPAGTSTVSWNGLTGSGAHAASGVYFVRVETAGVREVQRVTLLK